MLIVTPVGVGAERYFVGDGPAGDWSGTPAALLGLAGPVDTVRLRRVLAGRHPDTGDDLLTHRSAHRRGGWDLTFAAPKSLSLLAALVPDATAAITAAQDRAVGDAMAWLELHGGHVRAGGRRAPATLLGARFSHSTSDGGDPHLHTHVVLVNLTRAPDGHWGPVDSSSLWRTLRPLGSVYRLALRERAADAGMCFGWRQRGAGLVEVAGVPPEAVTAASRRHHEVARTLATWDNPELADRRVRRAVRGASRGRLPTIDGPGAGAPGGPGAPGAAGAPGAPGGTETGGPIRAPTWDAARAADVVAAARRHPRATIDTASLDAAVTGWLRVRGSTFGPLDVVRALGDVCPTGMAPAEVDRWVRRRCPGAEAHVDPGMRWTTLAAAGDDDALRALLRGAAARGPGTDGAARGPGTDGAARGPGTDGAADPILAAHRLPGDLAEAARRILDPATTVGVLPGTPGRSCLMAQAAVLAAARSAWEAAGLRVGIVAPAATMVRWEALAGLRPAPPPGADSGAQVVIVDRADRWNSRALSRLVGDVVEHRGQAVLVEGGTLPARHHPLSSPVEEVGSALRRGALTAAVRWDHDLAGRVPAEVEVGRVAVGVGPLDAVSGLLQRWGSHPVGSRPVLVGLGPAEVEALNQGARRLLVEEGALGGPSVRSVGRDYQVGDTVMGFGPVAVPAATVIGVNPARGRITVEWGNRRADLDRTDLRRVGHAYAVTPTRAAGRRALVLGRPRCLAAHHGQVVGASLVGSSSPLLTGGRPSDHQAPLRAATGGRTARDHLAADLDRPLGDLRAEAAALARRIEATFALGLRAPGGASGRHPSADAGDLSTWGRLRLAEWLRSDALLSAVVADPSLRPQVAAELGPSPTLPPHMPTLRRDPVRTPDAGRGLG